MNFYLLFLISTTLITQSRASENAADLLEYEEETDPKVKIDSSIQTEYSCLRESWIQDQHQNELRRRKQRLEREQQEIIRKQQEQILKEKQQKKKKTLLNEMFCEAFEFC